MTLTGACPGTVFPQIATRIPSAPYVLLGGLLGGILFSKFGKSLVSTPTPIPTPHTEGGNLEDEEKEWNENENEKILTKPSVYQRLGVS